MGRIKFLRPFLVFYCVGTTVLAELCETEFVQREVLNESLDQINLCKGFATTIKTVAPMENVILGNDKILTLNVISPNVVSIIGILTGRTNIHLFGKNGEILRVTNVNIVSPLVQNAELQRDNTQMDQRVTNSSPNSASTTIEENKNPPVRVVVNAGSAEILYECAVNCTKIDR